MQADQKSANRLSSRQCLFALLGSARVKAGHKKVVKLIKGVSNLNWSEGLILKKKCFKGFILNERNTLRAIV
jgi:hypothetical protein